MFRSMLPRTAFTLAAAGAITVTVLGQGPAAQPPATTQMVLKGRAPVSNEILRVKLPKPAQVTLANGLQLMVLEDRRLPQITFQLLIPGAGGFYDPPDKIGLANYTAAMMREGTTTRTSPQISEALDKLAAGIGVTAGLSSTQAIVSGSSLTESFDELMTLTADVLLRPSFPAEEWERFKARTKPGFSQQRTNPGFLAQEMMNRIVYGPHPASRITSTAAMLDSMTPTMLAEFHRSHFVPDHALMAFAGDISLADARRLVESTLGEWKKAEATAPAKPADPPGLGPRRIALITRPGSVQTSLLVGSQSLTRTDPDYVPLTVANRVIGGTMGRLFRHLREEKGYTYGIGSAFSAPLHRGSWNASTSVRTEVTEPALRDLLDEIAQLANTPVPAAELADAKRALVASFALSLENASQVLGYYIDSWQYNLPADYWDTYPSRIDAVTIAQTQAAAKKYLDAGRLQIVAVGDASIAPILRTYGEVEVYDSDGRLAK